MHQVRNYWKMYCQNQELTINLLIFYACYGIRSVKKRNIFEVKIILFQEDFKAF